MSSEHLSIHGIVRVHFSRTTNGSLSLDIYAHDDAYGPSRTITLFPDHGALTVPDRDSVPEYDSLGEAIDIVADAARGMGGTS